MRMKNLGTEVTLVLEMRASQIRSTSTHFTGNIQTRKRFSEKTNSCVLQIARIHTRLQYMTKPVWSHVLALSALSNHT